MTFPDGKMRQLELFAPGTTDPITRRRQLARPAFLDDDVSKRRLFRPMHTYQQY